MPIPPRPDNLIMPYLIMLMGTIGRDHWDSCIRPKLEKCSLPVCRYDILISDADQLDGCDCCDEGPFNGRVWARVASSTASGDLNSCQSSLESEVRLGISRCAVSDAALPSSIDLRNQAQIGYADRAALLSGIVSCRNPEYKVSVQGWNPLGPSGGCFGGYWTINIR